MSKIVLVTGASRGIGLEAAKHFSKEGYKVIGTSRGDFNLGDLTGDESAISAQLDLMSKESIQNLFVKLKSEDLLPSVLVNNAGITKDQLFLRMKDDDWDDVIDVNLKGPFICSQEALYLMKQNGGSIINIGSVSGQYGGPRTAHYAASKAGLISLGQVIARFGAKYNIRCNTLSAGLIESEMATSALQDPSVKKACENIILNRFGTYNEVADSVLFLASSSSKYITAQTLNLNGGLYF